MPPAPIEYLPRRGCGCLGLFGSMFFAALGVCLVTLPDMPLWGKVAAWVWILFFGLCGLVHFHDAPRFRNSLHLDAAGIHHRDPIWHTDVSVPWKSVRDVRILDEGPGSLVIVDYRAPGGLAQGAPALTLAPRGFGTTTTDLNANIERFWRYYGKA